MKKRAFIFLGIIILICGSLLCTRTRKGAMQQRLPAETSLLDCTRTRKGNMQQKLPAVASAEDEERRTQTEKGYNLPINEKEREEAKSDCIEKMERVLSEDDFQQAAEELAEGGCCVITSEQYANLYNYKSFEEFLKRSLKKERVAAVIYKILQSGNINRLKYSFDGADMYVLSATVSRKNDKPAIEYITYTRIKEWRYTDKGWFCCKLCVPEYPKVTEVVDGSCLIRVKPITAQHREISEKCVLGLGYQGNNLLCSNWDTKHMEALDYNGMYAYLYKMKYQRDYNAWDNPDGIPKEEFERLIMEYLPITAQELQKYAEFDEQHQTYLWAWLDCSSYTPSFFGTSVPEVTDIKENKDGTVTLTVDAVCEMILCDNAVITHELTVRFLEDGSFQYLGNKILEDGISKIPEYQYRISTPISPKTDNEISNALAPAALASD